MKHTSKIPLKDLLEPAFGAVFGVNTNRLEEGETPVIRVSDLPGHLGMIRQTSIRRDIPDSKSGRNAVVEKGDVVIVARGAGFRVGLVGDAVAGSVIAGNLVRLRPLSFDSRGDVQSDVQEAIDSRILGPVLAAYLQSSRGQNELSKLNRSSSAMMSLRVRDLLELQIPVPPQSRQELLAELAVRLDEHHHTAVQEATLRRDWALQTLSNEFQEGGVQ